MVVSPKVRHERCLPASLVFCRSGLCLRGSSASLSSVTAGLVDASAMLNPRWERVGALFGWWSRWPSWVGFAACTSALVYGCVVLAAAIGGHGRFVGVAYAAWPAAVVLLAGAVVAATSIGAPKPGVPRSAVSVAVWVVAALALAGSCWVLLNLIELALTGTVRDRSGNSDWVTFTQRLALAGVGALLVATAIAWQRRTAGVCIRCGQSHGRSSGRRYPDPHPAPLAVRRIAYAGCGLFLPYLTLHVLGASGVAGIEPNGFRPPWSALAAGVGGIGLAVFLLLGLVQPWGMVFPRWTLWLAGRRVPRFLPLAPVWLIAPTLALYGSGSLVYAFFTEYGAVGLGGAASLAFAGYGWALGIAAVSYQIRTRPSCASTDHDSQATRGARARRQPDPVTTDHIQ